MLQNSRSTPKNVRLPQKMLGPLSNFDTYRPSKFSRTSLSYQKNWKDKKFETFWPLKPITFSQKPYVENLGQKFLEISKFRTMEKLSGVCKQPKNLTTTIYPWYGNYTRRFPLATPKKSKQYKIPSHQRTILKKKRPSPRNRPAYPSTTTIRLDKEPLRYL